MTAAEPPVVEVFPDVDAGYFSGGVVVELPTGVRFSTQAGGVACRHPQAEGVFVPLTIQPDFPHVGCWGEWREEDIAAVRPWVKALGLRLDTCRMAEAMEAWIPVRILEGAAAFPREWAGRRGWLVTENCD